MHVYNRILSRGWLSVGLTNFTFRSLQFLLKQGHLPLLDSANVLGVLHEVEVHSIDALLIEIPEELAEGLVWLRKHDLLDLWPESKHSSATMLLETEHFY